jgi:ABC-type Co2+ transport system permease subunit
MVGFVPHYLPSVVAILPIVFLAVFIGGLLLAVFAMLNGVQQVRRNRSHTPSAFFNLPAVAAFAIGFGAAGYPLASRTQLPVWGILLIAMAVGALTISGMITLLAQWAFRGISAASTAEEEEIQGQLAIVTRDIAVSAPGEISYEYLGRKVRIAARAMGTKTLPVGVDVVIDRIEDGVAFVEEWAVVEQRL